MEVVEGSLCEGVKENEAVVFQVTYTFHVSFRSYCPVQVQGTSHPHLDPQFDLSSLTRIVTAYSSSNRLAEELRVILFSSFVEVFESAAD